MMDIQRRKERVALLSVVSNSALVTMKLVVGLLIGSVSIISEAIHSGVDLLASIIALFSVKNSSTPADSKHPFGHGKIENISGTVEALLIFVAAGWIIYEAAGKITNPEPIEALGWGVGVMLISVAVNIVVSEMLFKVGRETDSIALQADAWHLRTDVYTSAGVMASLALIWLVHSVFPDMDFDWMDPAAAIGVALLIIKAAYDLTMQSAKDLLDVTLPAEEEEWIRLRILAQRPVIHGFHQLRTRKSGHFRFVEFHLKVDPQMTVLSSHDITEEISNSIASRFPGTSVTIHVEPCDGDCTGNCLDGCLLSEEQRHEIQCDKMPAKITT
ncbi:MAG: cation diffusion facilitator family transporter [Deltaproteobacteria bacterium]|nr:cation diffusion facilitator family transporter [Deltaproteobacteria bacterium]